MRNLVSLNKFAQTHFLNSFDKILCDVDGVLWLLMQKIPGTLEAINSLKKIGKEVHFVSNNCSKSSDDYFKILATSGYVQNKFDLVTPTLVLTSYLKFNNFNKEIFVLGFTKMKEELQNAGFKIANEGPERINETTEDLIKNSVDNRNVGAVILDIDPNFNFIKIQKALTYLMRPEVLFIAGATDAKFAFGKNFAVFESKFILQGLEEISGRKPIRCCKPSSMLNNYIVNKYNIQDPSRVLFIGDSIPIDMAYATKYGYKKLLVLSGVTNFNDLLNWSLSNQFKIEYYVESLKDLHEIIEKIT